MKVCSLPAIRSLVLGSAVLGLVVSQSPTARAAWTPNPGSALANHEHPRILVTNQSLPAVKAKLGSGGVWHDDFKTWVAWADGKYSTATSAAHADLPYLAADYAFLWLTHPVAGVTYGHSRSDYGSLARTILMALPTITNQIGNYEWYGMPLAYDWVHPLLSSSDKATLVAFMKTVDQYSFVNPGLNPFNSQVTVARAQKTLSGLAVAFDGVDDSWASASLDRYQEYYSDQSGVTRSESDLGGDDGTAGQGASYGLSYTAPHTIITEEGWRVANGISLASHYGGGDKTFLRRLPHYLAYLILPFATPANGLPENRRFLLWKTEYFSANSPVADATYQAWLLALVGLMKDVDPQSAALSQWLLDNRAGELTGGDPYYTKKWAFWKFIMGDRVTAQSPDSLGLPLSKQFKDGKFVFRTGWTSQNDTYVTYTANEWMRSAYGMSPNYPGGFTIDRKGPQVIRQGGYSGHDWGSLSAGPSNILLFVDSTLALPSSNYDDEGGQRAIPGNMRGSIDFVQNGLNDLRDKVRYLGADSPSGRDVDYVLTDVTRAYNSTRIKDDYNPARVSEVVRQLVYFRPATPGSGSDYVVVFDRATTTDVKYEKRWLFHTSGEPIVNGTVTPGEPVRNGTGEGKWTYTAATLVTATNTVNGSNGRSFLTPLLPTGRRIVKVGGPNGQGQSWQTDSHEFESPFGVIYPRYGVPNADQEQHIGRYRVEIIPTVLALKDVFMNVVEVTDANVPTPMAAVALSGNELVAARVANRIAAFARNTDSLTTGDFTIDQAGTYRIHLADLSPATQYQITVAGSPVTLTTSVAGTLYVERTVSAGASVVVQRTGPLPQPPSAPSNVRIVPGS
jgi:hypothetical protein